MRYGMMCVAAAGLGLGLAGAAQAVTIDEATLCRSLTNIVIPNLEESLQQLNPEDVAQGNLAQIEARLDGMRALQAAADDWIENRPEGWSDEDVGYLLQGGDIIMGSRGPENIRFWTGQCREIFGMPAVQAASAQP